MAIILAVGAVVSIASCRDNQMSESFDELPEESSSGTGGSGSADAPSDLQDSGAHGSTGADHELLGGE